MDSCEESKDNQVIRVNSIDEGKLETPMLTDGSLSFTPPANPKKKFLRSFNFPAKTEKKQKRSFFNILKKKKFDDVFFESQMLNLGENVSFDDYS
jgi:hypothetical protein